MYAIEFEADVRNGILKIPDIYKSLKDQHVRVVILLDHPEDTSELMAFSEHSATLINEWRDPSEDEVWK